MNKELLLKLRGGSAAAGSTQQAGAAAAAAAGAPKPHHHFRLRPASEAPSQRQPGGGTAAASRPAAQAAPPAAGAQQTGQARGAMAPARPAGAGGLGSRAPGAAAAAAASSAARLRQPAAADLDSMFLPSKPSLQRPAGLMVRGSWCAPCLPLRAALPAACTNRVLACLPGSPDSLAAGNRVRTLRRPCRAVPAARLRHPSDAPQPWTWKQLKPWPSKCKLSGPRQSR